MFSWLCSCLVRLVVKLRSRFPRWCRSYVEVWTWEHTSQKLSFITVRGNVFILLHWRVGAVLATGASTEVVMCYSLQGVCVVPCSQFHIRVRLFRDKSVFHCVREPAVDVAKCNDNICIVEQNVCVYIFFLNEHCYFRVMLMQRRLDKVAVR